MDSFPEIEISEYKVFDEHYDSDTKTLNISYGIDENYLDGVGVSITSVILHNKKNIAFHVICDNYSSKFITKIEQLSIEYKVKIVLYSINVNNLDTLPQTKIWSRAMYFRLFAFDYFANTFERLLYLDADVICKGSIIELNDLDFLGNTAAVIKDVDSIQNKVNDRLQPYNLQGRYFNSGVVLVNLYEWSNAALTIKALTLLKSGTKGINFKYPDQDVLNILLKDKVIFLPREYNTIYTIKSELKDKTHSKFKNIISDKTKLIHYTGATKPWHSWACYPSVIYYKKAHQKSPWKHDVAKTAKTIVEFKKRYKHLLVQHHYFEGIVAGLAYLYRKITRK